MPKLKQSTSPMWRKLDVHLCFFDRVTRACPGGRQTIISLRCDQDEKKDGEIKLPPKCPDGTCDGCTFHFMWLTKTSCPICIKEDFSRVEGACNNGQQTIHYIAPRSGLLVKSKDISWNVKWKCFCVLISKL